MQIRCPGVDPKRFRKSGERQSQEDCQIAHPSLNSQESPRSAARKNRRSPSLEKARRTRRSCAVCCALCCPPPPAFAKLGIQILSGRNRRHSGRPSASLDARTSAGGSSRTCLGTVSDFMGPAALLSPARRTIHTLSYQPCPCLVGYRAVTGGACMRLRMAG